MATHSGGRTLLSLASVALFLCASAGTADAGGSKHPHFDDRGTLPWHGSLAAARAAARHEGKLVFIEFGRRKCTNCRKLAEEVLPHRRLRARMQRVAVGLAADCDRPERAVVQLFRSHLDKARSLPLVAFITPDGRWITGWQGGLSRGQVEAHLVVADRARRPVSTRSEASRVNLATPRPVPRRTSSRPPSVADLAQEAALRLDWEHAWSLFRAAGAVVDGRTGRAKTP